MAEKYTPQQIIKAIEAACGIKTEAARILGCHRSTIYNYVDRHDEVAQAADDAREQLLDEAEAALRELVLAGDFRAVRYTLNCLGRARGWGDRHQAPVEANDQSTPVLLYPASGILSRMRKQPDDEKLSAMMHNGGV